ncbi:MAG: hypothetical protein C5B47_02090 [Verrucomicrobia bacterium]|nr:MAG: hypothetical protein C5B47_02090 [Verrucomicrobiota bacterium]
MAFPSKNISSGNQILGIDDEEFFHSEHATQLKQEICEMGRRLWLRQYCEANGGNLSCRLAEDRFLVTPTGVSKGFMSPEMLCLVDGQGNQVLPESGPWRRSTEFFTHLAIYEAVPGAFSVCHAHPCHAGAFAIKQMEPPGRLIPEMEIFVGRVPVAAYETPGSPAIAASIAPLAPKHQAILLGLHGLICWGTSVEDAYFKVEITDTYCRTLLLALALPGGAAIPIEKMQALLDRKKGFGLPDSRFESLAEACRADPWECLAGGKEPIAKKSQLPDLERLIEKIVKKILSEVAREK